MEQKRLRNICQDILACWSEKKELDEEQGYIFFDGILDTISCEEEEFGSDYEKVSTKLNEMWQYKNWGKMSVENAFLCGSLWGGLKIAELSRKRARQQKTVEKLALVYANKLWFFEAISMNPGIRHKDLALKGYQSASQLSQFVNRVTREGLITYNRVGREKYYYLQKQGELVYAAIKQKPTFEYSRDLAEWQKKIKFLNSQVFNPKLLSNEASLYAHSFAHALNRITSTQSADLYDVIRKPEHYISILNNNENQNINISPWEEEELGPSCKKEMESAIAIANN